MSNKKPYDISHAESIMMNFFGSMIYIIFDNTEDVEEFFQFIKIYDTRFEKPFERINEVKSVAWIYSNTLHKHILAWQSDDKFLGLRYELKPISYSVVKVYIKTYIGAVNAIEDIKKSCKCMGEALKKFIEQPEIKEAWERMKKDMGSINATYKKETDGD